MSFGTFSEDPQATWLTGPYDATDRNMELLRDFWFKDPAGTTWRAPQGSVVNGASIPAPLWSTVGSPYTGAYRRASIVHDVACDLSMHAPNPQAARSAADYMFYQACRAGGCSAAEAELLYVGVRLSAWMPRITFWNEFRHPMQEALLATDRTMPDTSEESLRTTYREIAADLRARPNPIRPFRQLESLVDRHLKAKSAQYTTRTPRAATTRPSKSRTKG
ncbi:DUF1353 domain-containing protein [Hymenobacter elongatus]|uniref:DUF1353 domain-containing protein n=1 Tax=Hymenobacter elongatus TaxID=877208 RepID=A0A4Z0PIN2_9BACT|nr:DUF1353 domain-containing protein [Hymenobacter elongatus]TGE14967.1 DUF1353 domain-containing protein [Hymenobacter elongatus]